MKKTNAADAQIALDAMDRGENPLDNYEIVKSAIVETVSQGPMRRPQIYESVVPKYFLQYLKKDYRAMIDTLVFKEKKFS